MALPLGIGVGLSGVIDQAGPFNAAMAAEEMKYRRRMDEREWERLQAAKRQSDAEYFSQKTQRSTTLDPYHEARYNMFLEKQILPKIGTLQMDPTTLESPNKLRQLNELSRQMLDNPFITGAENMQTQYDAAVTYQQQHPEADLSEFFTDFQALSQATPDPTMEKEALKGFASRSDFRFTPPMAYKFDQRLNDVAKNIVSGPKLTAVDGVWGWQPAVAPADYTSAARRLYMENEEGWNKQYTDLVTFINSEGEKATLDQKIRFRHPVEMIERSLALKAGYLEFQPLKAADDGVEEPPIGDPFKTNIVDGNNRGCPYCTNDDILALTSASYNQKTKRYNTVIESFYITDADGKMKLITLPGNMQVEYTIGREVIGTAGDEQAGTGDYMIRVVAGMTHYPTLAESYVKTAEKDIPAATDATPDYLSYTNIFKAEIQNNLQMLEDAGLTVRSENNPDGAIIVSHPTFNYGGKFLPGTQHTFEIIVPLNPGGIHRYRQRFGTPSMVGEMEQEFSPMGTYANEPAVKGKGGTVREAQIQVREINNYIKSKGLDAYVDFDYIVAEIRKHGDLAAAQVAIKAAIDEQAKKKSK